MKKEERLEELRKEDDFLGRFYSLYLEGRTEEKAPISYIDYHKAAWFLSNEIDKILSSQKQEIREKVEGLGKDNIANRNDKKHHKTYYNEAISDVIKLLS